MNKEIKKRLSFCQVERHKDDRLYLHREADIINGEITIPFFDGSKTFENREFIYIKDEDQESYEEDLFGVWEWSAVSNRNDYSKDYVTYNYMEKITGIEISIYKQYHTIPELIRAMNTGIELFFESNQALMAIKKGKKYEALLVNYDDFDGLENNLYIIKSNVYKRPVYTFESDVIKSINGYPFYKSTAIDMNVVRYELLKQPNDIIKQKFLDRIKWNSLKNQGYTRENYKNIKKFISDIDTKSLIEDVQNILENYTYEQTEKCVNKFIHNINDYIDGDSLEDSAIAMLVTRNHKLYNLCVDSVEKEWIENNKKRIEKQEEYFKKREEEAELSLKENSDKLVKVQKEEKDLLKRIQTLENQYKSKKEEIAELELKKEEYNHIDEDVSNNIKQKIQESKKDIAAFLSEYTFLNSMIPSAQTIQLENISEKETVSAFIPSKQIETEKMDENDDSDETFVTLETALEENGIIQQKQSFASILYSCYLNNFAVLLAGPYGELLAHIISLAITGRDTSILDCSNEVSIQDIQLAQKEEIVLVKNCFGNQKKDYIIETLLNGNNFVIFTIPFSDELKIESKDLMNYMLPIFTEDLFEEIPQKFFIKGEKTENYTLSNHPKKEYRLSKKLYKKTNMSNLKKLIYTNILCQALQFYGSNEKDLEFYYVLYPMIYMNDVEEDYIDSVSNNNDLSKDMKELLLRKLGD